MSRKRLLVVTHDYGYTGAPILLFDLLKGLQSTYQIKVLSGANGPLRVEYLSAGIEAGVLPDLLSKPGVLAPDLQSNDLLLANTLMSYVPVIAASRLGKRSLWYLHEGLIARDLMARIPHSADAFAVADCVAYGSEYSRTTFASFRRERWTEVIPTRVPVQRDEPEPSPSSSFRVLLLGSITFRKGQDVAIAAMRLLNDPAIHLDIVGRIGNADFHAGLLAQIGDAQDVHFHNPVERSKTLDLIRACDLLIVPSRDEIASLVILEAMSLGKPVVASRVGGIPESIIDGENGMLFENENSKQLASLISKLHHDVALRQRLGANARQFQRVHRSLEQSRLHLLRVLDALH